MGLEGRLAGRHAAALGADVGGEGLVDALVSTGAAAVGEQDGGRALLARLQGCEDDRLEVWLHEVDTTRMPLGERTHAAERRVELLEVSGHLLSAAELEVTLRTLVGGVLHRFDHRLPAGGGAAAAGQRGPRC